MRLHAAPTGKPAETLNEGDSIVVMGILDPIGRELVDKLQKENKYKITTLLNPNMVGPFRNRYPTVNAIDATQQEAARTALNDAAAVVMTFEKPADTDTLRYLLGHGAEGETALKRFVLLSRLGVTRKGSFGNVAFFKNLLGRELDKYLHVVAEPI